MPDYTVLEDNAWANGAAWMREEAAQLVKYLRSQLHHDDLWFEIIEESIRALPLHPVLDAPA